MIKIVLVAGPLDSSKSYEYHNFLKPLEKMGHYVIPFDFVTLMHSHGREKMNQKLLTLVEEHLPDIVLFVPHTDELIPDIVDKISGYTITLGYLFDDTWRIEYSRFWAQHFNFVTSSDINGIRKFREIGCANVIYSPFACNTDVYCKRNLPKIYDVTFVGQYHPHREWYINCLRKVGIEVHAWGLGWPSGMINSEDMIDIFNQSRINLNLSNCVSWDLRYLITPFRPIKSTLRAWRQVLHSIRRKDMKTWEMVKGRYYEINACGGFQLCHYAEGLEHMYSIGEEIVIYASPEDIIEKIRYFLKHEDERDFIAQRGYLRTQSHHTMEKRFQNIFEYFGSINMNLPNREVT